MFRFKPQRAALLALMTAAPLLLFNSDQARAHAEITRVSPAAGSTVSAAPDQVTITLSERLEPKFSRIVVRDAAGTRVDQGNPTVSGNTMSVSLKPLPAGTYSVRWQVLSVDTHKTE